MNGDLDKRRWPRCIVCLAIGLMTAANANAQTHNDAGLWLSVIGNGKFEWPWNAPPSESASPLRWWFDGQVRFLDDADGFNQGIVRPGLGYALDEHHALWAGYAWIRTSPVGPADDFDEHRAWQQWTYTHSPADHWTFQHRSRFEQRWVETGDHVGLRWRQMFRAQYTLPDSPRCSLVGWDEVFFLLNDTDWGARAGFDQNRIFLGVGFTPDLAARIRIDTEVTAHRSRRGRFSALTSVIARDELAGVQLFRQLGPNTFDVVSDATFDVSPVPEPSAAALLSAVATLARRRRDRGAPGGHCRSRRARCSS
jgi:hypothetical protein